MDKRREIATLTLIGAPRRVIVGLIVQEALAMGFAGLLIGRVMVGLAADFFPRRVSILPEDGLLVSAAVVAICLVGSSLAVRMALRIDPASALSG
jgi:putative ABC transport system permease protein